MCLMIHGLPILLAGLLVTLQGRVSDVFRDDVDDEFAFIELDCDGKSVYACHRCADAASAMKTLQGLLGCAVSVHGHFLDVVDNKANRKLLRKLLTIDSLGDISVVKPPARGPFDVPDLSENTPALQEIPQCGPRKASGTVIVRWHGDNFLLLDDTGDAVRVRLRNQSLPPPGERVEVVGNVMTDLYHFSLVRAQWRKAEGFRAQPLGMGNMKLSQIFFIEGRRTINSYLHGRAARIRGTAKEVFTDGLSRGKILIEEDGFRIIVDCSEVPEAAAAVREGCEVEVMGIGVLDSENWYPNMGLPKVSGLFLVPRTAEDVKVLRQPPWWTPARFATTVIGLLALLAAILVWNATLRALVARKSRALLREQALKLSETLKIDERTRLAAELHDFHSQNLTAIAYRVSSARNACRDNPAKAGEILETTTQMLKSCRTELRRCLWDLRNDTLSKSDFAAAIRETVLPVAREAKVSVRFAGHRAQISDSTAYALLSILRELTANAVVHGHATSVRIAGEQLPQTIRFSVQDNGCGFDPAARPGQNDGHFGLDGIRERLNRLGGTLDIRSRPCEGTYVRLTLNSLKQVTT